MSGVVGGGVKEGGKNLKAVGRARTALTGCHKVVWVARRGGQAGNQQRLSMWPEMPYRQHRIGSRKSLLKWSGVRHRKQAMDGLRNLGGRLLKARVPRH